LVRSSEKLMVRNRNLGRPPFPSIPNLETASFLAS